MKKWFVWALALALTGLVSAQAQKPPVSKVGVLMAYTGALAEYGPAITNGIQLAADQLNAAATEVFGGPIVELVIEDSAAAPAQGVDRARKLVNVDGVVGIIGALSSGVTIAVAESVAIPNGVIVISPASTAPAITYLPDVPDVIYRTTVSDDMQGRVAAMLARGEVFADNKYDTAAVIYTNNPYGQGLADTFEREFVARGGKITAKVAHQDEMLPTYAAQLEQLLAGNPQVVLAASYPGQAAVYMAEARDLFDFTNWQFTDGTQSLDIVDAMGADAVEGLYGTSAGPDPDWDLPGQTLFVDAYAAAFGKAPPLPYIDTGYDAMATLGLAIAKAFADGVEVNSANVVARLRAVSNPPGELVRVGDFKHAMELIKSGVDVDYSGAASEVDFDAAGDVSTPIGIWKYQGGDIVYVGGVE